MVSARPPPTPAGGRVAYPTAPTYTPGDADNSPAYLSPSSGAIKKTLSRDSEKERAQGQGMWGWFRSFREKEQQPQQNDRRRRQGDDQGVFGVPLQQSMKYASAQVSTTGQDGALYVWGSIPTLIAKCGAWIKDTSVEVEGVFRVSGSSKRMTELEELFDTGPKYGKNIDFKTLQFSTHDVATIFRRFLTHLPEPVVPWKFYDQFRDVIQTHSDGEMTEEEAVRDYKKLIQELPKDNSFLLLYILDILSLIDKNSTKNMMHASNLALLFQPGTLSHPRYLANHEARMVDQAVLVFLIEHQDQFLMGMPLVKTTKKRKEKKGKKTARRSPGRSRPASPPRPVLVRAESDLMLPSDSDDEAPEGGYYVVEGKKTKQTSPMVSPVSTPTALQLTESKASTSTTKAAEPKSAPSATASGSKATSRAPQRRTTRSPDPTRPQPELEYMEPSDSDDDAPPGGYEVRNGEFPRIRSAVPKATQAAESKWGATESTSKWGSGGNKWGGAGGALARRKTVPARIGGGASSRTRRSAKEAP
ncbi:hypothetical protein IAT38_004243 [Cryptococcus sp. DSM 104549]